MGGISRRKGKEAGAIFEINAVANTIKLMEAQGKDTTFERNLLKSWSRYKGYELAKQVLANLQKPVH